MTDSTYDWWIDSNPVKLATTRIPTKHFKRIHMKVIMMLNRLYGQTDFQYSKLKWFPILHSIISKGTLFNWVDILSTSQQAQVRNA